MGIGVVLAAGGRSSRFGGPMPKQFLEVRPGRPLFRYAIETFHDITEVEAISLVLPADRVTEWKSYLEMYPKLSITQGGSDRWISVHNGFNSLPKELEAILIHDAARPFLPRSVVRRCLHALETNAAVITALPITDTIKEINGHEITRTLDRSRLVAVQTPQVFERSLLEAIYSLSMPDGITPTDEASLAESAGFPVAWVQGSHLARKITQPEDWEWAEWLAERLELGEITLHD